MKRQLTFLFFLVYCISGQAQNVDSLWKAYRLQKKGNKTELSGTISELSSYLKYRDADQAVALVREGLKLEERYRSAEQEAFLYETWAHTTWHQNKLKESITHYQEAMDRYEKLGKWASVGSMYSNIGYVYMDLGNYSKAIDYYQEAMRIGNERGLEKVEIQAQTYLADLYKIRKQYAKSLKFYRKSLNYFQKQGNLRNQQVCLNNIGIVFYDTRALDSALLYYEKALEIGLKLGDEKDVPNTLMNLGNVMSSKKKYEQAISYFERAIEYNVRNQDLRHLTENYANMGHLYLETNRNQKALEYFLKAKALADSSDRVEYQSMIRSMLADYYKRTGDYRKAMSNLEEHLVLKDSIMGLEQQRQLNELEAVFQNERQELEIDRLEKDKKLKQKILSEKELKLERESLFRWILIIGLTLLLALVIFIFFAYRNQSKANETISRQKRTLEAKNQEILDSMNYARRIQNAILPPPPLFRKHLPEAFVMYLPKDIVAGDFYWLEPREDELLFAVADCTGHGVPGAMVSVICNKALNQAVRDFSLTDPGEILTKTRDLVVAEFEKSQEEVRDGMDIALCSLKGDTLRFAGAHNPLWIVRGETGELEEIKADKQPIGKFEHATPYTTKSCTLQAGDIFYLFSDGFADQFGGAKGKKYKSANFKKLLQSIRDQKMPSQEQCIRETFEQWKGDHEQVDDICVMGVRYGAKES
ncbi:MAG: tetratricopeptide repeat protein [Bacteroidetes bacterium]|nr:MAG: tetratricopeptide repeat protein [Bacteroidota bacterium]